MAWAMISSPIQGGRLPSAPAVQAAGPDHGRGAQRFGVPVVHGIDQMASPEWGRSCATGQGQAVMDGLRRSGWRCCRRRRRNCSSPRAARRPAGCGPARSGSRDGRAGSAAPSQCWGGRRPAGRVVDHRPAQRGFDGARGGQGMAGQGWWMMQATPCGKAVCTAWLSIASLLRGRAVQVHPADVAGREVRIGQGRAHGLGRAGAGGVGRRHMPGASLLPPPPSRATAGPAGRSRCIRNRAAPLGRCVIAVAMRGEGDCTVRWTALPGPRNR